MNKRIRELAEQANASFGTGSEFAVVFGELEDFEKFAESIAEECASLFPLQHTDEQYSRRISKTIMKHFGMYR